MRPFFGFVSIINLLVLALVLSSCLQVEAVEDHVKASLSPLLTPLDYHRNEERGVWLPGTYGGVTGVVLDLGKIGTEDMLRAKFLDRDELRPLLGINYKLHSDTTTHDKEKGRSERKVILVDSESLKELGRKQVICYSIVTSEDRYNSAGQKETSKSTYYYFTMSEIMNDYEVLYLTHFSTGFPNSDYPHLTQPPK